MVPPEKETQTEEGYEAAGSYGQEIEEDLAMEGLEGDQANHGSLAPEERSEGSLGDKESLDTVGTNPKRTDNSRAN